MRLRLAAAVGVVLFAGWLWLGVASASAQLSESTTFGSAGSGAGEFSSPQGVAIDQSSGDVYVVDSGNYRVEKFDSAGNFMIAFGKGVDQTTGGNVCTAASGDTCGPGTPGAAAGEFSDPLYVAVDNSGGASAGDVYVGDRGADIVSKFDSSGNLIKSWGSGGQLTGSSTFGSIDGIAVDSSGKLLVINDGNPVYEFAQDGTAVTNFATGSRGMSPNGLAVDSAGNLFKVNGDGSVEKITSTGNDVATVAGDGGDVPTATEIALDPATNSLYVDTGTSIAEFDFDSSGNVLQPGASPCTPVQESGCNATDIFGTLGSGTGLAFDPTVKLPGAASAGALYVADASTSDVAVFVPPAPGPPSVLPNSEMASNVASDGATLNAQINPSGEDTHYYFEYVDNADYDPSAPDPYSAGTQIPLPPGTDIGSSFSVAAASANLTGLTKSTEYHFRVVASSTLGTTKGTDQTFMTATPLGPSVDAEASDNLTADSATLDASINPNFADTTYYFEYVDSADYNPAAPDPYSAGTQIPLPPGTDIGSENTDQLASVNLTGLSPTATYHWRVVAINSVQTTDGADQTFTTATPFAPSVDGEFSGNVTADSATLAASINPNFADTTYYFEYVDSADYNPAAPDPYSAGTQIPLAPGTDIGSEDTDQFAQVNLTGLTATTTYQWRVVALNSVDTTDGADQTFTTATPSAPSVDSESSSQAQLTTATLSAQINPEFADTTYYFEYVDSADYNPAAPDPYSAGTQVPLPPGTDIGSENTDQFASADLTGLTQTTTYHWRVVAVNSLGTTDGPDQKLETLPTAPSVDFETSAYVGLGTATLYARINPNLADTTYYFEYVDAAHYEAAAADPYGAGTKVPLPPGTDIGSADTDQLAGVNLSGLTPGVTYHFRVVATNSVNTTEGPDQTFTTGMAVTGAVQDVSQAAATLTGALNPNGSDMIYHFEYGTSTSYGQRVPTFDVDAGSGSAGLKVSQQVTGLRAGTTYHYRLDVSVDGGTTYLYGADQTFTTLPEVPAVSTGSAAGAGGAAVLLSGTVDANGSPTNYYFEYGPTTSYGSSAPGGSAVAGSAAVAVSQLTAALTPGTVYHFRLVATNAGGTTYGDDQTFMTAATAGGPPVQGIPGRTAPIGRFVLNRVAHVNGDVAHLVASCKGGPGALCVGLLALTARERVIKRVDGKRKGVLESVTIGRIGFDILAGGRATLDVKLAAAGRRLLGPKPKDKALRVTAIATQGGRRSGSTIELRVSNG